MTSDTKRLVIVVQAYRDGSTFSFVTPASPRIDAALEAANTGPRGRHRPTWTVIRATEKQARFFTSYGTRRALIHIKETMDDADRANARSKRRP